MIFLSPRVAESIHAEIAKRLGVRSYLRDEAALESALMRGENTAAYGDLDVFASAAGICAGIIRNMPFSSCNKQVALVCAHAFLQLNGWQVCAKPEEAAAFVLSVAAGEIDETGAAMFFRDFCVAVEGNT